MHVFSNGEGSLKCMSNYGVCYLMSTHIKCLAINGCPREVCKKLLTFCGSHQVLYMGLVSVALTMLQRPLTTLYICCVCVQWKHITSMSKLMRWWAPSSLIRCIPLYTLFLPTNLCCVTLGIWQCYSIYIKATYCSKWYTFIYRYSFFLDGWYHWHLSNYGEITLSILNWMNTYFSSFIRQYGCK